MAEQIAYRVVGTLKSIKGLATLAIRWGTPSSLAATATPGYAVSSPITSFPNIIMLQFGGAPRRGRP